MKWSDWARERAREHAEEAAERMRHSPRTSEAQAHALTALALIEVARSSDPSWEAPDGRGE